MSIILNGTTLSDIVFNGVSLDKVIYNGITGFEKNFNREPVSGEYFNSNYNPCYYWLVNSHTQMTIAWNTNDFNDDGCFSIGWLQPDLTSWSDGVYTYYRGTLRASDIYGNFYAIYRIKN